GSGGEDGPNSPPPEDQRFHFANGSPAHDDRAERARAMRAYNRHALDLGEVPILSPASANPPGVRRSIARARPGSVATRVIRVLLDEEATKAFDRGVRRRAKLAESSVMVIAVLRALDALLVARGFAPPRYAVPIPLSLDPKVGSERLLGNHLTMMMFAL